MNASTTASSSRTSIASTTSPLSAYRAARPFMIGSSSRHGGHQLAMKLTHTGLPRRLESAISPPPSCGTASGGAGWPIPNAAPGSTDASDDDTGEPDGDAEDEAEGEGLASATGGEAAGSGAAGPGARSTTAPTTIAPVIRPATR